MARDASGLRALIAWLAPLAPTSIALEATGGYETVVAASLAAAGLPVVVVNPAQVRAFAQALGKRALGKRALGKRALGKRAKTDRLDAGVIAHFAEATKPAIRPLPDAQTQRLADLVARRGQIVEMPDRRDARSSRCQIVEMPDRRNARSSRCQIVEMPDRRNARSSR